MRSMKGTTGYQTILDREDMMSDNVRSYETNKRWLKTKDKTKLKSK